MKTKKTSISTKFAMTLGGLYLIGLILLIINIALTDISKTVYVGFFASTVYPYLVLLILFLGRIIVPISLAIYFILLVLDICYFNKITNVENNENYKKETLVHEIILFVFFILFSFYVLLFSPKVWGL